jgi:hypothetical protein
MGEIYRCRDYFRSFKSVIQEDIDLVKQYPSILDNFDKNLPVRQLSYKIVDFYQAVLSCLTHYRKLYENSLSKELRQLYFTFLQSIVHEPDT